jgi:tRNA dimethylallyltransferase
MNGNKFIHDKLAELDPISAEKLNVNDTQRIIRAYEVVYHTGKAISCWHNQKRNFYDKKEFLTFCVDIERKNLYKRCEKRFDMMLDNGAVEEVERLNYAKINPQLPAMKALGVPELLKLIRGEWELDMAIENAKTSTRRYAKRQMTWFRNQLKDAACISPTDKDIIIQAIKEYS